MTISAAFTVNSAANPARHTVGYGATVNLAITSLTGIDSVEWSVVSVSHGSVSAPVITPTGSPSGVAASFTFPADPGDGLGCTLLVKCRVRGGQRETAVEHGVVGVLNDAGRLPIAPDEENFRDATRGWIDELNDALNGTPVEVEQNQLASVRTVVTSNVSNLASFSVSNDGVTHVQTDSVLLTAQSTGSQNGIYTLGVVGGGTAQLTRRADFDSTDDVIDGATVFVREGTVNGGTLWGLTTAGATLGTTALTFVKVSGAATEGDASITVTSNVARLNTRVVVTDSPYKATTKTGTTTATVTSGSAAVTLAAASDFANGEEIVIYGAGPAHGLATPTAPTVVQQGTTGATTWEFYAVGVTLERGYTARSALTTITNANATLSETNYLTIHATRQAGVHQWLFYGRRASTGNFVPFAACVNHAFQDQLSEEFVPSTVITNNLAANVKVAATVPEGLPATAPTASGNNLLRARIVSGGGTTSLTLDTAASVSLAGLTAVHSNKWAFEEAWNINASTPNNTTSEGVKVEIPSGTYRIVGDLNLYTCSTIDGGGAAWANSGCVLRFIDGYGFVAHISRSGEPWCPGKRYRLGDRICPVSTDNFVYEVTAVTTGISGTTEPVYTAVAGTTIVDGGVTWTCRAALRAASGFEMWGVKITQTGKTLPAGRYGCFHELKKTPNLADNRVWSAGASIGTGDTGYYKPTVPNGFVYQNAGSAFTSGGTEPTWPLKDGATVADNGGTWTAIYCPINWGAACLLYARTFMHIAVEDVGSCGLVLCGREGQMKGNANRSHIQGRSIGCRGAGLVFDGNGANDYHAWWEALNCLGSGVQDNSQLGGTLICEVVANGRLLAVTDGYGVQNAPAPTPYGGSGACHTYLPGGYQELGQISHLTFPAVLDGGNWGGGFTADSDHMGSEDSGKCTPRNFVQTFGATEIVTRMGVRSTNNFAIYHVGTNADQDRDLDYRMNWNTSTKRIAFNQDGISAQRSHEIACQERRGNLMAFPYGHLMGDSASSEEKKTARAAAAPTAGIWDVGDFVWDSTQARFGWTPIVKGGVASVWTSGTKRIGDICEPTVNNGFVYVVTSITAGTKTGAAGGTEPASWNTTIGGTTTDGGVVWTNWGVDSLTWRTIENRGPKTADLTDADQTVSVSDGSLFVQRTALTANRVKTIATTGTPKANHIVTFERHDGAAFTETINNNGPGGTGAGFSYVFASGERGAVAFKWDGTDWVQAGYSELQS